INILNMEIDTRSRTVHVAGKPVHLTAREYTLLEALATHEGQVLTRETIQERVWFDESSMSNVVEVHVRSLRKKLEAATSHKLIHTINRMGYTLRLEEPEEAAS